MNQDKFPFITLPVFLKFNLFCYCFYNELLGMDKK